MKLKPLFDRLLIEPEEANKMTKSGLVLPDSSDREKPQMGTVVSVGSGRLNDKGEVRMMTVKVGDRVLFKKYGPDEIELDGKKYLIAEESDILGILE
jgi:chaperonin GroES